MFCFLFPEGEQEEAWLTEAGLARLFDDSLSADQDQVQTIYLILTYSVMNHQFISFIFVLSIFSSVTVQHTYCFGYASFCKYYNS